MTDIITRSVAKGLRMTDQRRVIARVVGEAEVIRALLLCADLEPI